MVMDILLPKYKIERKISINDIFTIYDHRGNLSIIEALKDIPFEIKRIYYIWENMENLPRGGHAHKELWQGIIAMHGSCNVYIDNGITATNYILDIPNKMIILPPGYWGDLIDFVDDCVLLVLASDYYDESDYIRNYDEYIKYVQDREKNSLL